MRDGTGKRKGPRAPDESLRRRIAAPEGEEARASAESVASWQRIVSEAPLSIATIGLDKRFLGCNREFCALLGYSETELRQRSIPDITHPEDTDIGMADMRAIVAGDKTTSRVEKRYLRKDGATVWGEVSINLIRDNQDQPLHFLAFILDISERKRAERNLAFLNDYTTTLALQPPQRLISFVVERMKEVTQAAAVTISEYDASTSELVVVGSTLTGDSDSAIRRLLGRRVVGLRSTVSPDVLQQIIEQPVGPRQSISEVTFGAVPKLVGTAIEKVLGISGLTGVALTKDRRLVGTLMIVEDATTQLPDRAFLAAFASVTAGAIERQRAEAALRASETLVSGILENVQDAYVRADLDGRIVMVSPSAVSTFGYGSMKEMIGLASLALYATEDDRRGVLGNLDEHGSVRDRVGKARKKDGTLFWVSLNARFFTDEDGRPAGVECFVRDITERKRAEEELLQSEEALRATNRSLQLATERLVLATRAASIGVWDWDVVSDELLWDDAMYDLYGIKGDAFAGAYAAWSQAIHPEDKALAEEAVQAALRGEREYDLEFRVVWPDGSIHTIQGVAQTFRSSDGEPIRMIGVNFDMTERRRVEDSLRRSERMLVESQRVSRLGSWTLDVETRAFQTSLVMDELLGIDQAYDHSSQGWMALVHPDDRAMLLDDLDEAMALQGPLNKEFRIVRHSDKAVRWLHAVGGLQLAADGRPETLSGTSQDITERKQAEEARGKLEEQLRVSQKMEAIGSLAGGVAHDFNNLLSVILSYTEFAMETLGEGDPLENDLAEVKNAANRAVALTRQLLAFSRKQVLQPVTLDLNDIARGVEKMLRRILGEDIEFVQTLASDLGLTTADPSQIEQVLMNLVVNARDAMPNGGTLTIETSNVEVDEEYATHQVLLTPGRYVQIAVTDTGRGMDAAAKSRLFEPFFTTKENGKGTGLGLSTVYGIVTQSGGNICVYSELGKGTRFEILLPRDPSATTAAALKPAIPTSFKGTETILVVEDEEALRKVAKRCLEAVGYQVLTASDGEDALLVSARHDGDIQLLLTDVVMPRMGGRLLARELSKTRPSIKVIYMSGYTDDAISHHGVLEPGTHFLAKPFTSAAATQMVREVLDEDGPRLYLRDQQSDLGQEP